MVGRRIFDLLYSAKRYDEALAVADEMVAHDARDAPAHWRRAWALLELGRFAEGMTAADRVVCLDPDSIHGHAVRGALLVELGQLEASIAAFEAARCCGATDASVYFERGRAHLLLGDPGEALADFDRAIALNPEDVQAHVTRGLVKLGGGDWRAGFADLEWRLKLPGHQHHDLMKRAPRWQGEPLAGKRLLVCCEWDHGDAFHFVRYLRLIENSGAAITLAVPEASVRLLAANFPGVAVIGSAGIGTRGDFDFHASLMSLPAIMALESVPHDVPYLTADPERVAKWRALLGHDGFKVGIVWQGSARYKADRYRSVPLRDFAPLAAVPGVRLISVQALVGLDQLDVLPAGMKVERLGAEIENNPDGFREMAAVMANLDLLVMSDTGPTHLAGALGRPVWLATAYRPEWPWMTNRDDSPWYPTMRLFRQESRGDWPGVFVRMARELAETVAGRAAGRKAA